uniref:hypothetical protein n=1 Tax=Desertihabitans aurantiacus TaxID=2282477 RepID=UPI0018E50CF1
MSTLSRRRLLAAAALGTLPLTGCTWSSPVVRGGPSTPPPQPPPPPEVQDALRTEQTLAAVARALADGPDAV